MKIEDVRIGMKVVPNTKTAGFIKWDEFINTAEGKEFKKQGFMTVAFRQDHGDYVLKAITDSFGGFNASDFEPYNPAPQRSPSQRIKSVHIGSKTTVTLADGRIGTAQLDKHDSFDPVKGVALAYLRALGNSADDIKITVTSKKKGKPLSYEELSDREELCDHCPLPEELRGVHCYGGQPVMCEGSHCDEAYQNYHDDFEGDEAK